jgi:prefoldin subunit 2
MTSWNEHRPVYPGTLATVPALHGPWLSITPLDAPSSPLLANRAGRLVLETLEPLPGDRKCFRMINGVLVERTVKDVVPALRTNAEGLKKVLDDLVKQYKAKQDELEKWKVREKTGRLCVIPPALTFSQKKNNVQVVQS